MRCVTDKQPLKAIPKPDSNRVSAHLWWQLSNGSPYLEYLWEHNSLFYTYALNITWLSPLSSQFNLLSLFPLLSFYFISSFTSAFIPFVQIFIYSSLQSANLRRCCSRHSEDHQKLKTKTPSLEAYLPQDHLLKMHSNLINYT